VHYITKTGEIKKVTQLISALWRYADKFYHRFDICCFSCVMQPLSPLQTFLNCDFFYNRPNNQ